MPRLLTQIRKLEAKRAADARDAADANALLYVTNFSLARKVDGAALQPGEEVALDTFITRDPHYSRNFVMLEGVTAERITRDRSDFGTVYDARQVEPHHDYEAEPLYNLPVLGRADHRGRIEPLQVQFWTGAKRVPARKPAKVRRAGTR